MTNEPEHESRDEQLAHALVRMPVQPERPDFFADLRARANRPTRQPIQRIRSIALRRPLGFALATAILFALIGAVTGSVAAPSSHAAARDNIPAGLLAFAPAVGWSTLQSQDPNNPGVKFAWAANVPFAAGDSVSGEPSNTARMLAPDGIIVYASSLPTVADTSSYSDRQLPLKLSDGQFVTGQYENQPAQNVSKYMINAHVNGQYVYVEVLFGSPQPTTQMQSDADEELARLAVP